MPSDVPSPNFEKTLDTFFEQFACLQASLVRLLSSIVRSHDVAICVCIFGGLIVRTVGGACGVLCVCVCVVCVRASDTQVLLPCKTNTRACELRFVSAFW